MEHEFFFQFTNVCRKPLVSYLHLSSIVSKGFLDSNHLYSGWNITWFFLVMTVRPKLLQDEEMLSLSTVSLTFLTACSPLGLNNFPSVLYLMPKASVTVSKGVRQPSRKHHTEQRRGQDATLLFDSVGQWKSFGWLDWFAPTRAPAYM